MGRHWFPWLLLSGVNDDMGYKHKSILLGLFILLPGLFLSGCATPIGVTKVGLEKAFEETNASALSGTTLSNETKIVLQRYDLLDLFEKKPVHVITFLHDKARQDPRRDLLFALAELSFFHGKKLEQQVTINGKPTGAADFYLMSAVYAYDFLLGPGAVEQANPYDQQFLVASEIYNRALGKGLATGKDGRLEFRDGVRELPVGQLKISVKAEALPWLLEDFEDFLPADDYTVYGLSVRNRTPGLGLPLIALHKKTPNYVRGPKVPLTVFLRVTGGPNNLSDKTASASLEIYSGYDEPDLVVNGHNVPMETDITAPLAYQLSDADLWWQIGLGQFLTGGVKPEIIILQPYRPGRIPVVFIHGTASSPIWWVEMFNTLNSDPVLREHYQFWFFMYNSSLILSVSASQLREDLTATVAKLDPEGKDPALHEMVLVGHSQGGLLAKLSVVKTGDSLWRAMSDVKLEDLKIDPAVKEKLRKYFFIEPLPFVKRVVFIATPHRGSFRTTSWVRYIIRHLVTIPHNLLTTNPLDYFNLTNQLKLPPEMRGRELTSVDAMSPSNPIIQALAKLPVAPGITANSIIAVQGDGDPTKGNDGVVEYSSAHIDGVESEYIVRSEHSCQSNPFTIEEVRRILLVNLDPLPPLPPPKEGQPGLRDQQR